MKHSIPAIFLTLVLLIPLNSENSFSQQLNDFIYSKVDKKDQKKLNDVQEMKTRGELVLSNSNYPGDNKLFSQTGITDEKTLKSNLKYRYEAAQYFQNANSLKYSVYQKNIDNFWKGFTGNKSDLESVSKAGLAAADSFKTAQKIRKEADKKGKLSDKIPLLMSAESTEKGSLELLGRVLYTCLSWPVNYHADWFNPDATTPDTAKKMKASGTPTLTGPAAQQTIVPAKATENYAPVTEKQKVVSDSSLYSKIDINEDQIDLFNEFLQKKYPNDYQNYIINFQTLDYSDLQALRKAWDAYRFGPAAGDSTSLMSQNSMISADSSAKTDKNQALSTTSSGQIVQAGSQPQSLKKDMPPASSVKPVQPDQVAVKSQKTQKEESRQVVSSQKYAGMEKNESRDLAPVKTTQTTQKPEVRQKSIVASPSGTTAEPFLYKVQVAASRVALSAADLKGIYAGPENPEESFEEGWYKYIIGQFTSYTDANHFKKASGVPGAFVIAYLNGKRIQMTPSDHQFSGKSTDSRQYNPKEITFRLQIAASHIPLTAVRLKNIYDGGLQIFEMQEDGWYKYTLPAGRNIDEARTLYNRVNIPGAFITAFYQERKIDLMLAIHLTKINL